MSLSKWRPSLQDLDTEVKVGRATADRMLTAPGHQREGGCPSFLSEAQRPIAKNPRVTKDRKRRRGRTPLGRRNQQPRGCSSWRRKEREARGRSPLETEVGALGLEIARVCVRGQLSKSWPTPANTFGQTPWWQGRRQLQCPMDPRTVGRFVCAQNYRNPVLVQGGTAQLKGNASTFLTTTSKDV